MKGHVLGKSGAVEFDKSDIVTAQAHLYTETGNCACSLYKECVYRL